MQQPTVTPLFPGHNDGGMLSGRVQGGQEDDFMVQTQQGLLRARRAISCLLRPQTGDRVWLARDEAGDCFILAILEREHPAPASLDLPADTTLHCPGRLNLAARQGIGLLTPGDIKLHGDDIAVLGSKLNFGAGTITTSSRKAHLDAEHVSLRATTLDTVAERIHQRVKNCFRWVEETDLLKAGDMLHSIRRLFTLRAKQAMLNGEEDVKIDAKRIHMG